MRANSQAVGPRWEANVVALEMLSFSHESKPDTGTAPRDDDGSDPPPFPEGRLDGCAEG